MVSKLGLQNNTSELDSHWVPNMSNTMLQLSINSDSWYECRMWVKEICIYKNSCWQKKKKRKKLIVLYNPIHELDATQG